MRREVRRTIQWTPCCWSLLMLLCCTMETGWAWAWAWSYLEWNENIEHEQGQEQEQEQWPFFRQCVTLTSISVVGLTEYHTCLSTGKEMKRRCKMVFVTTIAFYSTRNRLIMRWSPQSTRRFVTLRILSGSIGNGEGFVEVWKEWWGRVDCKGEGREGWEVSLLLVHQDTLPWSFKQPSTPTTRSQTERLRLNETINSKGMIRFLWYHWVFYRYSNGKRP